MFIRQYPQTGMAEYIPLNLTEYRRENRYQRVPIVVGKYHSRDENGIYRDRCYAASAKSSFEAIKKWPF